MKKYTPYIFPLLVLIIVFFLVYRWYSNRNQTAGNNYDAQLQAEELNETELSSLLGGVEDFETVEMQPVPTEVPTEAPSETSDSMEEPPTSAPETTSAEEDSSRRGNIRFQIVAGKIIFSVLANLKQTVEGSEQYQVWVQPDQAEQPQPVFSLEEGKGGLMGTAGLSIDLLPMDVFVTRSGESAENVKRKALLQGRIGARAEQNEEDQSAQ